MNNQTVFIIIIILYLCFVLRNINLLSPLSFILPLGESPNKNCQKKTISKPSNEQQLKPESRPESRPESMPESRQESRSESMPESMPESRQESRQESRPESRTESRPESSSESMPESRPEIRQEIKTYQEKVFKAAQENNQVSTYDTREQVIVKRGDKTVAECPLKDTFGNLENSLGLVDVPQNALVPDFEPNAYNLQSAINDFGYATINPDDNLYLIKRSTIFPDNGLDFAQNVARNLNTR